MSSSLSYSAWHQDKQWWTTISWHNHLFSTSFRVEWTYVHGNESAIENKMNSSFPLLPWPKDFVPRVPQRAKHPLTLFVVLELHISIVHTQWIACLKHCVQSEWYSKGPVCFIQRHCPPKNVLKETYARQFFVPLPFSSSPFPSKIKIKIKVSVLCMCRWGFLFFSLVKRHLAITILHRSCCLPRLPQWISIHQLEVSKVKEKTVLLWMIFVRAEIRGIPQKFLL